MVEGLRMGVNGLGRTRHIPVAQAFRPEVCSGRGMIAVGAKNLTPQVGWYWGKALALKGVSYRIRQVEWRT